METEGIMESLVNPTPLSESLKFGCTTMLYADMVLQCSDGIVKIHRSILAAASPHFLRPLFEEYNSIETNWIMLPDVTTKIMNQVILILYTGQAISERQEDFADVILTLQMLGISNDFRKGWKVFEAKVTIPSPTTEISNLESKAIPKLSPILTKKSKNQDDHDEPVIVSEFQNPKTLKRNLKIPNINGGRGGSPHLQYRQIKHKIPNTIISHQRKPYQNYMQPKPKAAIMKPKKSQGKIISPETAAVIQEMLESGQLQLTAGPAVGNGQKNRIPMHIHQQPIFHRSRNSMNQIEQEEAWSQKSQQPYITRTVISNKRPIHSIYEDEQYYQNIPNLKYHRRNPPAETVVHPEESEDDETENENEAFAEEGNFEHEFKHEVEEDYENTDSLDNLNSESNPSGNTGIEIDPELWKSMIIDYGDGNEDGQEYGITPPDSEPDYSLTPQEILDGQKIATQKDHAYANFTNGNGNTGKKSKASKSNAKVKVPNRKEQ